MHHEQPTAGRVDGSQHVLLRSRSRSSSTGAAGQTMRMALANHLLSFIILLGILSQSACFYFGGGGGESLGLGRKRPGSSQNQPALKSPQRSPICS